MRCCRPFTPRQDKGGKPQLYCSTACRKGNAVPNAVPNANDGANVGEDVWKDVGQDAEEFSWNDDDSVVLQEQRRKAIYFNTRGELVIRQECNWPHEDSDIVVIIAKNNIEQFLDKLTDICGVPSFP